jgi:hypothetical protein
MPRAANDVSDTARNIIATISRNSERIFQRLREASDRLADYDFLVRELPTLNVSTHPCYQRRYNSFYVVRRGNGWRTHYYGLLQRKKGQRKVTFSEVIRDLHRLTRRIEPSFSSKLVATIRPDLPAYDVEANGQGEPRRFLADYRSMRTLQLQYARELGMTPASRMQISAAGTSASLDLALAIRSLHGKR